MDDVLEKGKHMKIEDIREGSFKCKLLAGNAIDVLKDIPENTFHMAVTSPPYWLQRDYGVSGQLGQEATPEEYIENLVAICRGVKRTLREDGTFWVNIGDGYCKKNIKSSCLKQKDLVGIPWMLAFAMRKDGWYLRSDIIWCLSGGTYLYVKSQKGVSLMTIKDLKRLKKDTIYLWNGEKWTKLLGISKSKRKDNEIEIVLRSGERISCTPTHKFPTNKGLLKAGDIKIGDKLKRVQIPEPLTPIISKHITKDAFWFAGLYIAEGSKSEDTIQIEGHTKEEYRWERLQKIAKDYGGKITRGISGNKMNIRLYGKVLNSLIDHLVTGRVAKNKGVAPVVWRYGNKYIEALLDGYLSGDGCDDKKNNRWRLGFCRNYNLERDLRVICARLGYHIVLNLSHSSCNGRRFPSFRGELRKKRSGHFNEKNTCEVVEIRKSRCREVYDIGVEDEPHLFALASGILTHNSKTNPMPESTRSRPSKSHEHLFLFAKSDKYFYDAEAIAEPQKEISIKRAYSKNSVDKRKDAKSNEYAISGKSQDKTYERMRKSLSELGPGEFLTCNKKDVWELATANNKVKHFAIYPSELIKPCILAGSSSKGCCPKCQAPWVREGKKNWNPSCDCGEEEVKECIVLDPFNGSGTTGRVCKGFGRKYVGIDISDAYLDMARESLMEDGCSEEVDSIEEFIDL